MLSVVLAACGASRTPSAGAATGPATGLEAEAQDLNGEEILQRVCTACHDLGGLDAFADYWGEPEWRSMMDTMISYGAQLTPDEYEVLARYLAEHYGPGFEPAVDLAVGDALPPVRLVAGRRWRIP